MKRAIAFLCSKQTSFAVEDRLSTYMTDFARGWHPESGCGNADLLFN